MASSNAWKKTNHQLARLVSDGPGLATTRLAGRVVTNNAALAAWFGTRRYRKKAPGVPGLAHTVSDCEASD
jgi:hypothetical protein